MKSIVLLSPFLAGADIVTALISELSGGKASAHYKSSEQICNDGKLDGQFIVTDLTPEGQGCELLLDENVRPIFLVRSIFDLVVDQYRYYAGESSVPQEHYLVDASVQDGINMAVWGGVTPNYNIHGLGKWARQQQEMLRFSIENSCCILSYEKLFFDPRSQITSLATYLGFQVSKDMLEQLSARLVSLLEEKTMLSTEPGDGFRYGLSCYSDDILQSDHYLLIDAVMENEAPDLGALSMQMGMHEITALPPRTRRMKLDRLFVSTVFKSGTKLLEYIMEQMTGLSAANLGMEVGSDYKSTSHIRFEDDKFFIWHNVPSPVVKSRLRGEAAKPVFLVRNIYDLCVAQYFHFANDVDQAIGHSTGTVDYFGRMELNDGLSLVLSGARSEQFTWHGFGYYLHQIQEILQFSKEYPCHIIVFDRLVRDKENEIHKLASFLDLTVTPEVIDELLTSSSLEAMREARVNTVGSGEHFRKGTPGDHVNVLAPYHYHIINHLVHEHAPMLPQLCKELNFGDVLSPISQESEVSQPEPAPDEPLPVPHEDAPQPELHADESQPKPHTDEPQA